MNEKKELLKNHFNTLKSKLIELLKVTSKFMMSNSAFRQNASHRTQQRKSVGTAEFFEKLSNVAKIHDSAKLFLKDAVLIGHSQETDGFKVVNQYRKTVDEQFSPIVEQYTKEIVEAQQEGETVSDAVKDGILQLLIDVNAEFVQNMKHLRDGIVTLRKEVTQTIASKDLPQKLADAKVQKRLDVIKTTPPSPKPEKRQKKKVVAKEDDDNDDEDDESGEDLGDEDSILTNEDEENEGDDEQTEEQQPVVTKKKRKIQEKKKKDKKPEPLADDADAETSSSADGDVAPPPKKKTRQQTDDPDKIAVQKLQDEQTIADAKYQDDYEKRQRKIDTLRDKIRRKARQQRIAQTNKDKGYADASMSSDDKVEEEENGVEGSVESDEDFDYEKEHENRKKKKLAKKVQEVADDEQAVTEPVDDVPADAMQEEQQEVAEQPTEEATAVPNEEDF